MPTVILASRYNNLRNRVNTILGESLVGTPDYGYGQTFNYETVTGSRTDLATADTIDATQYRNLYLDLIRIRIHQIGATSVSVDPFVVGDYDINEGATDKVEEAYVNALESLATNIETDRFEIDDSTQADIVNLETSVGNPIISSRSSALGSWNGALSHIFDVTFDSAVSRRHFFNAGGQIRLNADVDYAGSQAKSVDWQSAVAAMGTISIAATTSFSNAGSGSGTNIGNYQLTSSYQRVYNKQVSGAYSRNYYNLYALSLNDTTIRVKAEFFDGAPNSIAYGIDEPVLGSFSSGAQLLIPNGSATINGVATDTVVYSDAITGSTQSNL